MEHKQVLEGRNVSGENYGAELALSIGVIMRMGRGDALLISSMPARQAGVGQACAQLCLAAASM